MYRRLISACALAGIALTFFGANSVAAEETNNGEITAFTVATGNAPPPAVGQPTAPPPPAGQPTETPPAEPGPNEQPPAATPAPSPAEPPQVPVKPEGAADTGSLDTATVASTTDQGPGAGVLALGGVALLGAGGLGVAAYRRRQRA